MLKTFAYKTKGFSLIEMMISLLIGVIITSAAIAFFITTTDTDFDRIKTMRLNHELRTVMNLLVRDIRRTGYNADIANVIGTNTWNPFIRSGGNFMFSLDPSDNCILFAYDATAPNGVIQPTTELFGFRRSGNAVQMRTGGTAATCASTTGWETVTDDGVINISTLSFIAYTTSVSATTGNGKMYQCSVDISLTGRLANATDDDVNIVRTINETVKLRNDIYYPNTSLSNVCQ